jgi:hypothetical protein
MAYMMMLVADNADWVDAILEAWSASGVQELVLLDSTCTEAAPQKRPHIPMRFMFERMGGRRWVCSTTLFGVAMDEAALQHGIESAEAVIGDLDAVPNAMFAAWPLAVLKGLSKR